MTLERLLAGESVVAQSERQLLDRFISQRDELAFEAIVARHGPMVVGVCRSILDHSTDVDDAFQATFLILVRKAGSLRDRDQLSPWLHGVARRVALRARGVAARRRGREIGQPHLVANAPDRPGRSAEAREFAALLHAEIDRLALAERSAILLCDLQGLTHQEAADQLGWPLGTVKTRINRGRDRLRVRLSRQGVTLGAVGITSALAAESVASVVVARTLIVVTTRSALAVVVGRSLAVGLVSAPVYSLTQGAVRAMIFPKLTAVAAGLALSGMVLTVPGVVAYQSQRDAQSETLPTKVKTVDSIKATPPDPVGPADVRTEQEPQPKLAEDPNERTQGRESKSGTLKLNDLDILRKLEQSNPLQTVARGMVQRQRGVVDLRTFLNLLRESTIDADAGLPDGFSIEVTQIGQQYSPLNSVNLISFQDAPPATPLRILLSQAIKPMGLCYRVGDGKLIIDALPDPISPGGVNPARSQTRLQDDEERNEAIHVKLDQVVPLKFPQETTLDDFVTYIKQATRSSDGRLIPIYVDPNAIKKGGAQQHMVVGGEYVLPIESSTAIRIELEDVPLRTSLRLALRQMGLDYDVAGGVLIIGDMRKIENLSRISTPGGMGQGMGGLGGGMGGMGGMM